MMRTIFWILLLGNVVLFAAMQWSGALSGESEAPMQPGLHQDKVRLLDAPPAPPAQSAPAATQPTAASKPEARACLEWGEFSGSDLERATAALGALQLGAHLGQREVEYSIGYWVYIPPLKDKAAVAQKVAQLKARGIEEYFVVQEAGVWLNAISLGVFKTREAAQNFVNDLRAKDVRSAQVGERGSRLKATVFVLSGPDADTAAKLAALHKDFPGSELKDAPCALTR